MELVIATHKNLSSEACPHSTRYIHTNKIVSMNGKTHIGWLDMNLEVQLRTYDHTAGSWHPPLDLAPITIGTAVDNHGGPAHISDSDGYLHCFYYPHAKDPFKHTLSNTPWIESSWATPTTLGTDATYPSAAIDNNGTIHMTYRRGHSFPRELVYLYLEPGKGWSSEQILARPPQTRPADSTDYAKYQHSISITNDGELHLLYAIQYDHGSPRENRRSRWVGHMKKALRKDGQWSYNEPWTLIDGTDLEDGTEPEIPISNSSPGSAFITSIRTTSPTIFSTIRQNLYVSNLVLDSNGNPIFALRVESENGHNTGIYNKYEHFLCYHDGTSWHDIKFDDLLPKAYCNKKWELDWVISIDDQDTIYLVNINHIKSIGKININAVLLLYGKLTDRPFEAKVIADDIESRDRSYNLVNIERSTSQDMIQTPWIIYSYVDIASDPNNAGSDSCCDDCEKYSIIDAVQLGWV